MKRKYFSVIAVLAISLGLVFCSMPDNQPPSKFSRGAGLVSAPAAESASDEPLDAEYFRNINRSIEIYDQVMSSYVTATAKYGEIERSVYSDNFAGVWLDEQGFLIIGIVAGDEQIRTLQNENKYNGQAVYKRQAFSYNFKLEFSNFICNLYLNI
jgi:hypothetical protein